MSRLSSSPPPLARFHWCHCPQMAQLWSLWDHTKPLGCQFQGLGTLHTHTNHAGSCTRIAAPKHRELEAALLSTPEMLSKKLLQYSLHNPLSLCVGYHEQCSLESLRSSHVSQEQKLAVGRVGELAKGRACCPHHCFSGYPFCVPPPNIMSSYLFLAGREMERFQCLGAFSYCSNP